MTFLWRNPFARGKSLGRWFCFASFSHSSILEFDRGAYNQVFTPDITRPRHALIRFFLSIVGTPWISGNAPYRFYIASDIIYPLEKVLELFFVHIQIQDGIRNNGANFDILIVLSFFYECQKNCNYFFSCLSNISRKRGPPVLLRLLSVIQVMY